jgi:hypothetical protein
MPRTHQATSNETVLLLGAGASQEAGVPTSHEMTERLVTRVAEVARHRSRISEALHFVCGVLLADEGARGESPFAGLDVERVFAAVELLAERDSLEASPFVAAWHPGVGRFDSQSFAQPNAFNRQLSKAVLEDSGFGGAQQLIEELIDSRTGTSGQGRTYAELAEAMVGALRELVATTPKQIGYLQPILRQAHGEGGLTVATLNYDRTVEQIAHHGDVPLSTGVAHWLRTGRWDWLRRGIRLLKLHGSIDWAWKQAEREDGQLPRRELQIIDNGGQGSPRPAVIFGNRGKLQAEGPFLALLAEFEKLLTMTRRLVVIGYSFRDRHINEVIARWLNDDVSREIIAVDPGWPEHFPLQGDDFRQQLELYLDPGDFEPPPYPRRLYVRRETCGQALAAGILDVTS